MAEQFSNNTKDITITGSVTVAGVAQESTLLDVASSTASADGKLSSVINNLEDLNTTQETALNTLVFIDGKLPASLGTKSAATSLAVTLATEDVQDLYMVGAAAQTVVVNNILTDPSGAAATDLTGYRSFSIQIVSTATGGTYIMEGSNDNVNFRTVTVFNSTDTNGSVISAAITPTASALIYVGPVLFRYMRVRIATTITGGSIQAYARFSQTTYVGTTLVVGQIAANSLQTLAIPFPSANTGGLASLHTLISAATTNATLVKASQGTIGTVVVSNAGVLGFWFKLFNLTVAPTVGTSVANMTIFIPPASTVVLSQASGMRMLTGISYCTTANPETADTTAILLNQATVNISYN